MGLVEPGGAVICSDEGGRSPLAPTCWRTRGSLPFRLRLAQQGMPAGAAVRVQRALCAVGALWSCSASYHWGRRPVRLSVPGRVLSGVVMLLLAATRYGS